MINNIVNDKKIYRASTDNRAAAARCFGLLFLAIVMFANQCPYMTCLQGPLVCTAPALPRVGWLG